MCFTRSQIEGKEKRFVFFAMHLCMGIWASAFLLISPFDQCASHSQCSKPLIYTTLIACRAFHTLYYVGNVRLFVSLSLSVQFSVRIQTTAFGKPVVIAMILYRYRLSISSMYFILFAYKYICVQWKLMNLMLLRLYTPEYRERELHWLQRQGINSFKLFDFLTIW